MPTRDLAPGMILVLLAVLPARDRTDTTESA